MSTRRLPPLHAVRAFEAAARHLSITHAARELNVTPGAVSRHVRTLEETLKAALFVRRASGLELTPVGRSLADGTREALDRLEEATAGVACATSASSRSASTAISCRERCCRFSPGCAAISPNWRSTSMRARTRSTAAKPIRCGDRRLRNRPAVRPGRAAADADHDRRGGGDHAAAQGSGRLRARAAAPYAAALRGLAALARPGRLPCRAGSRRQQLRKRQPDAGSGGRRSRSGHRHRRAAWTRPEGRPHRHRAPGRRPTRRHFTLQYDVRFDGDPSLVAFADWLCRALDADRHYSG